MCMQCDAGQHLIPLPGGKQTNDTRRVRGAKLNVIAWISTFPQHPASLLGAQRFDSYGDKLGNWRSSSELFNVVRG